MGVWLQSGGEWFLPPEGLPGALFMPSSCPGHDHLGPTFLVKHDWGCDVLGVKIVHQRFLHCQSDRPKRNQTFMLIINVDGEVWES